MSVITARTSITSVGTRIVASTFSTSGSAIAASGQLPVRCYILNSSNARAWVGGTSGVTSANGFLITTGGSQTFLFYRPEELWAITSAAVATTFSLMFTNQPV